MTKRNFDKQLLFLLIILSIISILTIYSAQNILPNYLQNLYVKQALWYILGFLTIIIILKFNINWIFNHIWIFYIIGNLLLLLLLIIGKPINGAKCWFEIYGIGSFQPSEFMKLVLIILLSKEVDNFNKDNKNPSVLDEFILLIKIGLIVLVPSILTFLEPDTGNVLIYLLITLIILLISGIRYGWFLCLFFIVASIIIAIVSLYFLDMEAFKSILGDDFFLRINRLLDWSKKDGYQLEKGLVSIGSGGLLGRGIKGVPLYFPEAQTDFIFAVYASSTGFIGSIFLITILTIFDLRIIYIAKEAKNKLNKYFISGVLGILIFQQFQNIAMTFGLMPITGITLPFISYGGSSLILFMIMIGIILNFSAQKKTDKINF